MTICIAGFSDLIARNLLSTEFLPLLEKGGHRIVILTTKDRETYFKKEYEKGNTIVEAHAFPEMSRADRFWYEVIVNLVDTSTMRTIKRSEFTDTKKVLDYTAFLVLSKLGRLPFIPPLIRALYGFCMRKNEKRYADLFEKYSPDLVIATDVQSIHDIRLLAAAKARKIKTLGMVRSWDNLTSKGILPVLPNWLIVHNEEIKYEAIRISRVPEKNIFVINGIPHYDHYQTEKRTPREEFLKKIGLDPNKKTIFYAPPADHFLGDNDTSSYILELLMQIDANILVRLPIWGSVGLGKVKIRENVFLDNPRTPFKNLGINNMELSREKDFHLADCLAASDVVFSGPSSLAIDAAFFGKPIIMIGFDNPNKTIKTRKSVKTFLAYNHLRSLVEAGGVRVVGDPKELQEAVREYFENPAKDKEGRERIVEEKFGTLLDGRASHRLADFVLSKL